jgi:hypothetical protein
MRLVSIPDPPTAPPPAADGWCPPDRDLHRMTADGSPDPAGWDDPDWRDNLGERDTFDDQPAARVPAVSPPPPEVFGQQTHRVRYTCTGKSGQHRAADVKTLDVSGGLDLIPGRLPPGAYILSVEDIVADRAVHWTRWPVAFRPGFGG